jgi:5-methylcytosine-specific restriction endonuclease McrA
MTLARPCLRCGTVIAAGSRCPNCTPAKAKTAARGYGTRWQRLARAAIKLHPWCTDCSTTGTPDNPLTGDHLRWPAHTLADIEVVCRRCNSRRGARRKVLTGLPDDPPPVSQRVTQGPVVA